MILLRAQSKGVINRRQTSARTRGDGACTTSGERREGLDATDEEGDAVAGLLGGVCLPLGGRRTPPQLLLLSLSPMRSSS